MNSSVGTSARILDVAEQLIQTQGYNGFSYQDVADRIGIRKASIHHHYSGKAVLAAAVVERYRGRWQEMLAEIDRELSDPRKKLDRYFQPFRATIRTADRACLCGMLGAEFASLEPAVKEQVKGFFTDNKRWLAKLLNQGKGVGVFEFRGTALSEADLIFSCLEGALLVARACGDANQFEAVADQLKARLRV
jgi:TetR/AcrR family transcriptional repressor of nem operon